MEEEKARLMFELSDADTQAVEVNTLKDQVLYHVTSNQ